MYDVSLATFSFIMGVFLTCFAWVWLGWEYAVSIEKDLHEYNDKVTSKKIAGHKSAFTKVKKNYAIAKKIIRKGRNEN